LCVPLVIVYQFFVLPAIDGFVLLSAVLGLVLIPAGIMLVIPRYAPIGLALALGFSIEMSLQTSYTADLAAILNSNSAFVLGGVAALVVTRLIRVIGTQASARRLMRATYRDLAYLCDGRTRMARGEWASRMLDRVALLVYRQPRFERPQHEFADALEDLRLGINIIETRSVTTEMSARAQHAFTAMFSGLAAHFRALARGRVAKLGHDLLQKIDLGIDEVATYAGNTKISIAAIVGLRRTLYPDAPPYRPMQTPDPTSVTSERTQTASTPGWESVP
jgi:uncharacterized membrane protein YccC